MSDQIQNYTSITSNALTDPATLNLYTVWEETNHRLLLNSARQAIGQNIGALVVRSSDLPLPDNAVLSWDAAEYDFGGFWDASSSTILQVPNDNISHVTLIGNANLDAALTTFQAITFYKNGADLGPGAQILHEHNADVFMNLKSTRIEVNSGDYFEMRYDGGASNNQNADTNFAHWFAIKPERFRL